MRKCLVFASLLMTVLVFAYCSHSKKATSSTSSTTMPKATYSAGINSIMVASCAPCHIPAQGGRVKALDTYAGVKDEIDDIIRRIELNPEDKGFMPMKHPKLSDSTIAIIKQWKADGMLEN